MTTANAHTLQLDLPVDAIGRLCRDYGVSELAVFGSVAREDFHHDSDVDFLVTFANDDAGEFMGKYTLLGEALSELLGRSVDIVGRRGIEHSRNPIRRRKILSSARVIYAER